MRLPKTILLPVDFTEGGDAAVDYTVQLANQLGATVHLLHVVTFPSYGISELGLAHAATIAQTATIEAQGVLDFLAKRLRDKVALGPTRLEVGDAREIIDRVATEIEADLIVMGTHGRRGFSRLFVGSVTEEVVRTAPCPVLTVHRDAATA